MAYEKINFSRTTLAGLPDAPAGKRLYYADTKEPGLLLCVSATGSKSFQVYLKVAGRPVRVTLGRFSPSLADSLELPRDCSHREFLANAPELNVRMSRALAALVKIDLKSGTNPADAKRTKRAELTLGEMFEEYVTRHLIPYGKKSIKEIREDFERYLGELPDAPKKRQGKSRTKATGSVNWQRRQLSSIGKAEIQRLHSDLGREVGKHAGNKALILIRSLFNRAIDWSLFNKPNPAAGIHLFKVNARERFLQSDELPRFFESLALEPSLDVRDYVLLSLCTGARKANVLAMRWADVNLDRAIWRVEGQEMKNSEPLSVPLIPEAVDVLRHRKPKRLAEFVFPGRGKSGHLQDAKRGWRRVLDRDELIQLAARIQSAGAEFEWPAPREKQPRDKGRTLESLEESLDRARQIAGKLRIDTTGARIVDLRIHDMRRTLGSYQAASGASLVIIGKSLGQKSVAATQIYSRLNLDPVRDSVQTAARAIFAAGGILPKAEVTPIAAAKAKRRKASA
ncbi:MAG: site-specific integrase [Sulfuritalea sp.]|nr:site-specific integrase [Sulfuritalea sp.]